MNLCDCSRPRAASGLVVHHLRWNDGAWHSEAVGAQRYKCYCDRARGDTYHDAQCDAFGAIRCLPPQGR
jgi:hypothetical protein